MWRTYKKYTRSACIVDIKTLGVLTQYAPIKSIEDKEFQRDIFMFKLAPLKVGLTPLFMYPKACVMSLS